MLDYYLTAIKHIVEISSTYLKALSKGDALKHKFS